MKPRRKSEPKTRPSERMSRYQIALRAGIDRDTVCRYLAMKGAPKPDEKHRFDYVETMKWISARAPRALASDAIGKLRQRKLEIEVARLEREEKIADGTYITEDQIAPPIARFTAALVQHMREAFEFELPAKYAGRTTVECQQLNIAAMDSIILRLKEGTWELPGVKAAEEAAALVTTALVEPAAVDTAL